MANGRSGAWLRRLLGGPCPFPYPGSRVVAAPLAFGYTPDNKEDTVVGFLLAGVGNVDLRRKRNYLIVDSKTTVKAIEDAFKDFTTREDIAIVLINQYIANMIRYRVDSYNQPVPAILEIPSKDHPYDPTQDSVLSRVRYLFSAESIASSRY
ncbi:V-type proton ATPase subunit F isoform X1 [Phoenix dactylifera]|uniref:V-type proton ATPase subunit F isoform X1 n=1 Tax=Phoenix dactylifera TaxID=42345 RepID=A0A8B7CUR9_PHODC|nr:V-type proton ATPase subunit F isoform X1 [Phoenix dactylifera]